MRRCKARKTALHAGGMRKSNGSGYWGQSAENLYRWVWAGRTACVTGRPLRTMLSRRVAWPSKGISNQLRSAGAALQRLEPVAGCGSTLDALHQTVVWAWSHAKSRMLAVWGIADIGHHQPGWRGATDRFPVNWTGGFDPEQP